MSGHQPGLWHPGIAAKVFAADAFARASGAAAAWLVIDTDDNEPLSIDIPAADAGGSLRRTQVSFDPSPTGLRKPSALRPPAEATIPDLGGQTPALAETGRHLARTRDAINAHRDARSLAEQITLAWFDVLGVQAPHLVFASELPKTTTFLAMRERMRSDPAAIARGYNASVAAHPEAGVSQLRIADDTELPLWRVTASGTRLAMRASLLVDARVWPKALLNSGLARASLCDLFIHGTGGLAYEPINDGWLAQTLEQDLAPFVGASATLRLPLAGGVTSEAEAAAADWQAHHARHHPETLGAHALEQERATIVEDIRRLPFRSEKRLHRYRDLQRLLADYRETHADRLAEIQAQAEQVRQRASEQDIRCDRTWSALLHDRQSLQQLRTQIVAEFTQHTSVGR